MHRAASRASTVTSVAEREAQSYFWSRMKEQYQERKTARRQSQLGTAGCVGIYMGQHSWRTYVHIAFFPLIRSIPSYSKLGRPCCLALHSVSLRGAIPPGAQVHIEVAVAPGEHESHNSPLASFSPASPLATPLRHPVAHGNVDTQGRVDHVLIPSVTATSSLVLTVVLTRRLEEEEDDGSHNVEKQQPLTQTIATLRYPLADVTATLRPTELRLTPESHGEHATAPRARSPSALLLSPFGGGRRRSESPTPTPARASPPPTAAGGVGAETAGAAAGLGALLTLGAVWGELTFFDNRTYVDFFL